jgi:hypothetical protein
MPVLGKLLHLEPQIRSIVLQVASEQQWVPYYVVQHMIIQEVAKARANKPANNQNKGLFPLGIGCCAAFGWLFACFHVAETI